MVRMFASGARDWGSILGRVISKTQKMVLGASFRRTQHNKERIKGKWNNPGKELSPSPTHLCSNYEKAFGSPSTTVDWLKNNLYIFYFHTYSIILTVWKEAQTIQLIKKKYYSNWFLGKNSHEFEEKTENICTAWKKSIIIAMPSQKKKRR